MGAEGVESFWTKAVLIMLPAVVTPLLAWLSSLRAASRRASELDFLLRRLELVERAQKVQGDKVVVNPSLLDAELQDILSDLAALRELQPIVHPSGARPEGQHAWRAWFITYKQLSTKGRVYKTLFYVFLSFASVGGLGLLISASEPGSDVTTLESVALAFLGGGFYVAIAIAFRAAAVREYRRRVQKEPAETSAAVSVA